MPSTVLVTSTGGAAAASLMLALESEAVRLLACDVDPAAPGLRSVPPDRRFVIHRSDNPEFIGDLLALCVRCDVDLLVPTGDSQLVPVACAREVFERMGTRVLLAPASALNQGVAERRVVAACRAEHAAARLSGSASRMLQRLRNVLAGHDVDPDEPSA
ncbi:MAG TPA: hypothetical protein VF331_09875 [Polyangiales bacterium]